ncbi:molybdenum cofactor guanylyltransferase [Paenibacillus alkaliterrae]|uniref:molybdenum cofactor guanylyltransferase n=1 Tax=Paenibacillus alkaliterrae TaxID=320909 RepID=UPI001F410A64|nr:molybdenum cofactor guanylyltransferase [Paenibacillus alkaliterrae]MCF2938432.1 molybdenum cofactor guanylyltransferase [Paenibacillus alkaliterrae]
MQHNVHGLILAGGQSSRMGSDKALLPVGGTALLYRLASQLSELTDSVIISVGSREREVLYREALGNLAEQISFVADRYPGCGPLSGLHAGLSAARNGYVFVIACDMPQLSGALFEQLTTHIESGADVIHYEGQPFHALYHSRTAPVIQMSLEEQDYRVMGLLRRLHTVEVEALDDGLSSMFTNLNTPDDYMKYVAEKK